MSENIAVRPSQLKEIVKSCLRTRQPLLVQGPPGVGKTEIMSEAAQEDGYETLFSHPAIEEPSDSKGIPWPDQKSETATYLVAGTLAEVLSASTPTAWFIDDLGQAMSGVQAPYMQWVRARQCGGHKLPDCVSIMAATNRRSDKAGVTGLLEPVKSRFIIVELTTSPEDWADWAITHDMPPELIAYLRNVQCDALHQFTPTADIVNSPNPRTWAMLGEVMRMGLTNADVRFAMFQGCVGPVAAAAFATYLKMVEKAPSIDAILASPATIDIPVEPDILWTISSSLASRATKENFAKVSTYVQRMHKEGYGEFGAYLVRDMLKRDFSISQCAAWHALAKTPVGTELFAVINSIKGK